MLSELSAADAFASAHRQAARQHDRHDHVAFRSCRVCGVSCFEVPGAALTKQLVKKRDAKTAKNSRGQKFFGGAKSTYGTSVFYAEIKDREGQKQLKLQSPTFHTDTHSGSARSGKPASPSRSWGAGRGNHVSCSISRASRHCSAS